VIIVVDSNPKRNPAIEALRFAMLGLSAGLGFFLRRAFVIGNAGFVLGLISTIVLTLPHFVPTPELMVRFALWLWAALGLGIAGAVAANLFLAPVDPAALLREELVRANMSTSITRRQPSPSPTT
jgi:hypothetical protein